MADEPRRSGRATKGQHKNLEHAEVSTPKNKKAAAATPASKKNTKKSAEPEPEPEPELEEDDGDEEAEEEIRCVCGDDKDNVIGRAFISCDTCSVWQHNVCMGVPLEEEAQPDNYFCEKCHPEDHQELLEAMDRGEKLWEKRLEEHEAEKRRRRNEKKRPKNRKSAATSRQSGANEIKSTPDIKADAPASETSPAPASTSVSAPAEAPTESQDAPSASNKRKFEEETAQKEQDEAPPAKETRRSSSAATQPKRRKSEQKKEEKVDVETALVEIEQLPKDRQGVAVKMASVFGDVMRDRINNGFYTLGEGDSIESVGRQNASRIEYELFQVHGAPSSSSLYGQQFRAILANFKNNPMLVQRMLDGGLTAHGLATMSSQDMASDELQKQRQQLKEEADKQAVIAREDDDDKPRVRRTHKGDEYIDDREDNTHESVFTSQPVRVREDHDKPDPPANADDAPAVAGATAASPDAMDVDRRESNFDIALVWAKTPADQSQSTQTARRRSSLSKSQNRQEKGEKHDADVDRMLADDNETDYAPPEANGVVWKGQLIQPGVTEFTACARHAAGNDFGQFTPWNEILPRSLEIDGRLEAKRADDYLCGLQWSTKSDVSVLALTPYDNRAAFDQIFDYFASRGRYAVVAKGRGMSDMVKDVYITPVGPGHRLPPHIDLLEYTNLDVNVPERMLLVTFVVSKPDHWENPAVYEPQNPFPVNTTPSQHAGAPQFSPRPPQGFTPMQNGHTPAGSLPPKPYAQSPSVYPPPAAPAQAYPSTGPQQQQQAFPPHMNPMVTNILGPLAQSPVVATILAAAGNDVQEHVLLNMRDILASDPAAREDLNIFQQRLARGQQQSQT